MMFTSTTHKHIQPPRLVRFEDPEPYWMDDGRGNITGRTDHARTGDEPLATHYDPRPAYRAPVNPILNAFRRVTDESYHGDWMDHIRDAWDGTADSLNYYPGEPAHVSMYDHAHHVFERLAVLAGLNPEDYR